MIIAEYNVLGSFYIYNEEYFGGILPIPFIKIRHSWSTLGYFHCNPDMPEGTSETIEISDFYDYTLEELRDIIVHEMVHYYLYYTGEDMRVRHGKAFKQMAKYLNREYGLNITVKVDVSNMKPRKDASYLRRLMFSVFK